MTAQPKPLRFLFSKYAALAPNRKGQAEPAQLQSNGRPTLRSLKLPSWNKSGSLGDLHLLGSDVSQSKLDRIHIFLALSEVPGQSPASVVESSVGSNSTQEPGSRGQSRGRARAGEGGRGSAAGSPSRFRSRSQEFENIYRLAASRCSPEFLKSGLWLPSSSAYHTSPHQFSSSHQYSQSATGFNNTKHIQMNGKRSDKNHTLSLNGRRADSANSNDRSIQGEDSAPSRGILQVMIEEKRNSNVDGYGALRHAHQLSYSYQELNKIIGGNCPVSSRRQRQSSVRLNRRLDEKDTCFPQVDRDQRICAGQLPRCNSLSTVDADRLDSSCYHYLLEGLTSDSSCGTPTSAASDRASSKASARAQRPSTSGTEATTQRLRNLHTRTTDLSSPPSQTQSQPMPSPGATGMFNAPMAPSSSVKSPEHPWPPRYALIPSWPSYEDIQTLNGPDFSYGGRRGRRSKDREKYRKTGGIWGKGLQATLGNQKSKIHVVPTHTSTECEKCNLFNTQCAQHKTSVPLTRSSSPSNLVDTAETVPAHNGYHKQSSASENSQQNREINNSSQSKRYFPPATATTNSSLKVNIGIKEPVSASTSGRHVTPNMGDFRHGQRLPNAKSLVKINSHKSSFAENSLIHQHHLISPDHHAPVQNMAAYSERLNKSSQKQKSKSGVAYSWDRASKVTFVNTTV